MGNPVKVEITGDASSLLGALNQSTAGLRGFAKDVDGVSAGLSGMMKNLTAPLAALAGLVGGGAFLKSAAKETVDWTVQAQKLARVLGTTTENASVMGVAIKGVHGDIDTFMGITAKMVKTLNSNETAFNDLGVATRDNQGHLRGAQEVLLDTFGALSQMKEGTDRNVASVQIFGRGWLETRGPSPAASWTRARPWASASSPSSPTCPSPWAPWWATSSRSRRASTVSKAAAPPTSWTSP